MQSAESLIEENSKVVHTSWGVRLLIMLAQLFFAEMRGLFLLWLALTPDRESREMVSRST